MYICICNAVTDSRIREFVEENGCNWRKLADDLRTGKDCGSCAIRAKKVLTESCGENHKHGSGKRRVLLRKSESN